MNYSEKQIENAKRNYNAFLQYTTAKEDTNYIVNPFEAERRAEYHNSIVSKILAGDKELEKEWKLFFLNEEAKKDAKVEASKAKLQANKAASADILSPIKGMKKLGEFGKWLNNSGNPYRKQHFNKKYTVEAVNEFLATL
jgi:hypothetical protein